MSTPVHFFLRSLDRIFRHSQGSQALINASGHGSTGFVSSHWTIDGLSIEVRVVEVNESGFDDDEIWDCALDH